MDRIAYAHVLVPPLLVWIARADIELLLWDRDALLEAKQPSRFSSGIPQMPLAQQQHYRWERTNAWRRLGGWLCLYVVFLAFLFIYYQKHTHLQAAHDAACSARPPRGCDVSSHPRSCPYSDTHPVYRQATIDGGSAWTSAQTWRVRSWRYYLSMKPDPVVQCAEWLERLRLDVWPNPLVVIIETLLSPFVELMRIVDAVADACGRSVARFVSHFNWPQQLIVLAILVGAVMVCAQNSAQSFASVLWYAYMSKTPAPVPQERHHHYTQHVLTGKWEEAMPTEQKLLLQAEPLGLLREDEQVAESDALEVFAN